MMFTCLISHERTVEIEVQLISWHLFSWEMLPWLALSVKTLFSPTSVLLSKNIILDLLTILFFSLATIQNCAEIQKCAVLRDEIIAAKEIILYLCRKNSFLCWS